MQRLAAETKLCKPVFENIKTADLDMDAIHDELVQKVELLTGRLLTYLVFFCSVFNKLFHLLVSHVKVIASHVICEHLTPNIELAKSFDSNALALPLLLLEFNFGFLIFLLENNLWIFLHPMVLLFFCASFLCRFRFEFWKWGGLTLIEVWPRGNLQVLVFFITI